MAQREFRQIYPQPGWVEHDPEEIWRTQLSTAKEALAKAGLNVVALERGSDRGADDYAIPYGRDELKHVHRHTLMQNVARDTLTVRNNMKQEALPMRRLGSFLPGEGVGGSGVHWSGVTWRWSDMEMKVRSMHLTLGAPSRRDHS